MMEATQDNDMTFLTFEQCQEYRGALAAFGITQRGFARARGISESAFRALMRGKTNIHPETQAVLDGLAGLAKRFPPPADVLVCDACGAELPENFTGDACPHCGAPA